MFHDIIFIGGGFRTVSFLLADYRLLELDLCIVERIGHLGPGKFKDLDCLSNSNASTFLRHLDHNSRIANKTLIKKMAVKHSPVSLTVIGRMLEIFGKEIKTQLPPGSVVTGHEVLSVDLRPADRYPVKVVLSDGNHINAKFCILGTGQSELLMHELLPWKEKVLLSGQVLSASYRPQLLEKLKQNRSTRIVIVGCSHSAFACAKLLCDIIGKSENPHFYSIEILHRRKVHIYYPSVDEARIHQDLKYEEEASAQFICEESGEVFRDSGIKYEAKAMYRSIYSGKHDFIKMHPIENLYSCSTIFDGSNLIIQATGLKSILPPLSLDGRIINEANDTSKLLADICGILSHESANINGLIAQLRVMALPDICKDRKIYNKGLYNNLRDLLLTKFHSNAR